MWARAMPFTGWSSAVMSELQPDTVPWRKMCDECGKVLWAPLGYDAHVERHFRELGRRRSAKSKRYQRGVQTSMAQPAQSLTVSQGGTS